MSVGVAEVKELAGEGGGGLQSWVGCMPSAGGERPGFTTILSDNHFHNPKAAQSSCSGGLRRSRYVRCVCALYNPNHDPSTHLSQSSPATCFYVSRRNCAFGKLSHSMHISQKAQFFFTVTMYSISLSLHAV